MSIHQKLNPNETEMTELKRLWRDSLSEEDRDYWREQFESSRTQAELREEIQEKYGVALNHNIQLRRFRSWAAERDAFEEEKRMAKVDKEELEAQGYTGEKLRDEILRRMKARALSRGDFKLGLKAILADMKNETLQLGHKKFEVASRAKIEIALLDLAEHIKGNTAVRTAYEAFCATVKETAK